MAIISNKWWLDGSQKPIRMNASCRVGTGIGLASPSCES